MAPEIFPNKQGNWNGAKADIIFKEEPKQYPHREICGLCHRVSPVGFWVPNEIWEAVVHSSRMHDIHCLTCFIERADEKLIDWSKDIKFYPTSLKEHITGLSLKENVEQMGQTFSELLSPQKDAFDSVNEYLNTVEHKEAEEFHKATTKRK